MNNKDYNERSRYADPNNQRNPYQSGRDFRPLLPDEKELWNDCMSSGFLKVGLPVGILSHFIRVHLAKRVNKPLPSLLKQSLQFGLNCFFGTILYSPVCFNKLQQRILQNEKKIREKKLDGLAPSSGSQNILENDLSSESYLQPKLDEFQSNFSHLNMDFASPMEAIKFEEETAAENKPKIPETTYDELRKNNRYNYKKQELLSIYDHDRTKPSSNNLPEREPEKIVPPKPKNKYGDEME